MSSTFEIDFDTWLASKSIEDTDNKVTSLSSQSTDTQYPSAKAVYDFVDDLIGDAITYINQ